MSNPYHRRSLPDYFISSPLTALLYPLHQCLLRLRGPPRLPPPDARPIRVVCISDTHSLKWADIPDGDLLIHAGDLTNDGSVREIQAAVDWLRALPHPHKVVVCGNHDSYFDVRSRLPEDRDASSFTAVSSSTASLRSLDELDSPTRIEWGDIHYLQHSSVTLSFPPPPAAASSSTTSPTTSTSQPPPPSTTLTTTPSRTRSLTLYGAPQVPALTSFGPEHAFTYPPPYDAWTSTIPAATDILITHTPPQSHLDMSPVFSTGCPYLLAETWRVRPALHVFGHIHNSYGREPVFWDEAQRAWERLCMSRRRRARLSRLSGLFGLVRDLFDVRGLVDAVRVLGYGVLGVVWAKVWGGEEMCGWMVNAACMVGDSGRLGNRPQVVEL